MLERLHIRNVAVIDELEIDFRKGFNVLTGETGAGKSIIIDSLNFVLGEKADKELIKSGADMAEVTAVFSVNDKDAENELIDLDVRVDEENCLLMFRSFSTEGKSNCKVNGRTVTVGILKEIAKVLIDVHGQYDNQSLLDPWRHLELLDRLCYDRIGEHIEKLENRYKGYKKTCKALEDISGSDTDRQEKIDMYTFQIQEIEDAKLENGEEEKLNELRAVVGSSAKIKRCTDEALDMLLRNQQGNVRDCLANAIRSITTLAGVDESKESMVDTLESLSAQLDDIISDLRSYEDGLDSDPRDIDEIEARLDVIYGLKKKYGKTIEDIKRYAKEAAEKLEFIKNSEDMIMEYNMRKEADERVMRRISAEISEIRKEVAVGVAEKVEKILGDLGMINAVFKISITDRDTVDNRGTDRVEFLVAPNVGEDVKPLSKIASGGEMSRVMLALKVVLSEVDNIETFIFDEIDTGISGRTAQRVAEKIAAISKYHQVLCITHLPQIAAMADSHFEITKKTEGDRTAVRVKLLKGEEVTEELARLIGGAEITDATMAAAEDMKKQADTKKVKIKGE
ncbi:MAG: DNA repair protein RecN [Firmicutes bacterium]|nr:DNA repair protein RecN [Bacillota bacterium]